MENHNNRVYICGRIVHMYNTCNDCVLVTVYANGHYPNVVTFGELARELWEKHEVGTSISLGGYLVSSKRQYGVKQSIVADTLYPIDEKATYQRNDVYLRGIVHSRLDFAGYTNLKLFVHDNGHLADIPVVVHGAVEPSIKRGTAIEMLGIVVTKKKNNRYYQDYHAQHILTCSRDLLPAG